MEKGNEQLQFKKYELLIKARNFHYENFNKWMTYFYVAIGALFVGFNSIKDSQSSILPVIAFLGYTTSLFWYWSSKGYYYWNINFITLVNHFEKDVLKWKEDERIYFVFANKDEQNSYWCPIKGANFSTSKIAILFAFIIAVFWGISWLNELFLMYNQDCLWLSCLASGTLRFWILFGVSTIFTTLLSYVTGKTVLKSKNNHFPNLNIHHKVDGRFINNLYHK